MQICWEQRELPFLDFKSAGGFVNAAFAQQDDLTPGAVRAADGVPFF